MIYNDNEMELVATMHKNFGFDVGDCPNLMTPKLCKERLEKMHEELEEFRVAYECKDLEGAADALVDLAVFLKGTAVMMGLPWGELWNDVMRANMAKKVGVAPGRPDHEQDLIKPEGWIGPKTHDILQEAFSSINTASGD